MSVLPWMLCSMTSHFLSAEELAERLGVRPKTLANWRYKRQGPMYLKVGGVVRYRRADVEAFEEAHTVQTDDGRR